MLFSGVEVELGAVDDVLPHDVGSGAYGDEWVKIGECHPDAEDGVFLAETLCSRYAVAQPCTHFAAYDELQAAHHK